VGAPWPPNLGLSTREYVSRMRAAVVHKHDLEGLVNIKEKTVFLDKVMKNYELDGDDRLEEEVFLRQLRREGGHSPPGYRRAPHSGSHVTLQATPPSASPTCLSARWGQSRPSSRERQQDGSFSARAASRNPTSPTKQQHLVDREAFDHTQSKLHQAALKGRGPVQGRAMTGTGRVKAQRTAHEEVDATDATVEPLWLQVDLLREAIASAEQRAALSDSRAARAEKRAAEAEARNDAQRSVGSSSLAAELLERLKQMTTLARTEAARADVATQRLGLAEAALANAASSYLPGCRHVTPRD